MICASTTAGVASIGETLLYIHFTSSSVSTTMCFLLSHIMLLLYRYPHPIPDGLLYCQQDANDVAMTLSSL
jgi:hypothetical protein